MERGLRRELERQGVVLERDRVRLAQHRRHGDRPRLERRQDGALPGLLELLQLDRGRRGDGDGHGALGLGLRAGLRARRRRGGLRSRGRRGRRVPGEPLLQLLQPEGGRLAREVGRRARHLDERELERQPRVAALAHVVDGHGQEVHQPQHRALAELVRLLAQPVPRLLGHRHRLRHLADVLDEHELAQVLEQVGDEAPEVLALLGELLEEGQRARGVAVDHEVADAEERLLLDGAEELEHGLDGHLLLRRGGELVERRDGVAERAARRPRDERERRVGRVDRLGVGDPAQQPHELVSRGRWKTKVWQRERTVGSTLPRSVVQKTKSRCGGGSSISFSSAFQAASVSWCASSRM